MKTIKKLALAVLLVLSATGLSAGCLNDFNNNLYSCGSGGFGYFTQQGCKLDVAAAYYHCLYDAATM